MSLKNRSFLKLLDYTPAEIGQLLELAADLKAKKKAGIRHDQLRGKNIALIFEKTSTRTRCSFEVAAHDLGMEVTYLDPSGSQIGKKESIADTARVLGRMFDGIEYRGYGQQIVEELAHYAGVPVWNGLTNEFHPTQILADFLTIQEHFGHLKDGGSRKDARGNLFAEERLGRPEHVLGRLARERNLVAARRLSLLLGNRALHFVRRFEVVENAFAGLHFERSIVLICLKERLRECGKIHRLAS